MPGRVCEDVTGGAVYIPECICGFIVGGWVGGVIYIRGHFSVCWWAGSVCMFGRTCGNAVGEWVGVYKSAGTCGNITCVLSVYQVCFLQ